MRKQFITLFTFCLLACQTVMVYADEPQSLLPEVKKEALTFRSNNDLFKISFNGRIQADGALFFGDDDSQPIGNGVGFRRVRFSSNVSFGERISGRIEMDFTDGSFSLKDCFIGYALPNGFILRAGNFKESFGMDAMTSSGDLMFMEKASVSTVFAPEFHMGLQVGWQRNQLLGAAGVHFKRIGGDKEKALSETNNKNGVDEGISYTARGVWMPRSADKTKGLHLGLAASYRTPKSTEESPKTVRYSGRTLSIINKLKYLDTGAITAVSHDWLAGVELGGFYKAFRVQGEYVLNHTSRMDGLGTEKFNGFYLQAAYLLFGGQQQYSTSRGAFSEPTFGRPWGDVELAARFDRLDLNGDLVQGGAVNGWTFGATYYVTRNLKTQLNYSYVNHDAQANAVEKVLGGSAYSILGLRIQLNF